MYSFGVQILKDWRKFCAVIAREDLPIVRRNIFWNVCAFWREVSALPRIQSRLSYLPDKNLREEDLTLPDNCHFLK
jgi:hypothetical protein